MRFNMYQFPWYYPYRTLYPLFTMMSNIKGGQACRVTKIMLQPSKLRQANSSLIDKGGEANLRVTHFANGPLCRINFLYG
jgi:hypothetical protein